MRRVQMLATAFGATLFALIMVYVGRARAQSTTAPDAVEAPPGRPARQVGGYFGLAPGLGGGLENGAVGVSAGGTVTLPVGRWLLYHASVGFMHLGAGTTDLTGYRYYGDCPDGGYSTCNDTRNWGAASGVAVEALSFGRPIRLYEGAVRLQIEPVVHLLDWNCLFTDAVIMTWDSGAALQVTLEYERFFATVTPIYLQTRFFAWADEFKTGVGLNYPIRIAAGTSF